MNDLALSIVGGVVLLLFGMFLRFILWSLRRAIEDVVRDKLFRENGGNSLMDLRKAIDGQTVQLTKLQTRADESAASHREIQQKVEELERGVTTLSTRLHDHINKKD